MAEKTEEFFNPKLCKELRSVIVSSDIFVKEPGYKERYNLTCAVMDRLDSAIKILNQYKDYPKDENDFVMFMVYACMVVDGVKKLLENIFHQAFDLEEKKYFVETQKDKFLKIKEEDFLSDDKMFEYFRSLTFAHPYDTHRYFKKYFGTQVSPWVSVNGRFTSLFNGINNAVLIKVYTQKIIEFNRDVMSLCVPFNSLKEYVNSRYLYLNKIIKWLKDEKFKIEENWKNEKINRNLEPISLIEEINKQLEKRYVDNYGMKELYYYLTCPCSEKANDLIVKTYRDAIINELPGICDAVDNLDRDKIDDIVGELTSTPKKMHNGAGYQLEKIYIYLHESFERTIPDVGSNEEWGLIQADEFSKEFARKWVKIDVTSMSNSEIKMLVAAACYFEKKKQEGKLKIINGKYEVK